MCAARTTRWTSSNSVHNDPCSLRRSSPGQRTCPVRFGVSCSPYGTLSCPFSFSWLQRSSCLHLGALTWPEKVARAHLSAFNVPSPRPVLLARKAPLHGFLLPASRRTAFPESEPKSEMQSVGGIAIVKWIAVLAPSEENWQAQVKWIKPFWNSINKHNTWSYQVPVWSHRAMPPSLDVSLPPESVTVPCVSGTVSAAAGWDLRLGSCIRLTSSKRVSFKCVIFFISFRFEATSSDEFKSSNSASCATPRHDPRKSPLGLSLDRTWILAVNIEIERRNGPSGSTVCCHALPLSGLGSG